MKSKVAAYVLTAMICLGGAGAAIAQPETAATTKTQDILDSKDIGAALLGIGALAGIGMVVNRRKTSETAAEGQQTVDA